MISLYLSPERDMRSRPTWMAPLNNGINPERLSTDERLAELTEILAAGLMRLQHRQSSQLSLISRECSLHISPNRSDVAATYVETVL